MNNSPSLSQTKDNSASLGTKYHCQKYGLIPDRWHSFILNTELTTIRLTIHEPWHWNNWRTKLTVSQSGIVNRHCKDFEYSELSNAIALMLYMSENPYCHYSHFKINFTLD